MAATIMRADRWNAGAALMQAQSPQAWRGLMDAGKLMADNSAALGTCRDAAAKSKKEQHCILVVPRRDFAISRAYVIPRAEAVVGPQERQQVSLTYAFINRPLLTMGHPPNGGGVIKSDNAGLPTASEDSQTAREKRKRRYG